eukprot:scaffold8599_cov110-Isochrysis_galbana.AAC.1
MAGHLTSHGQWCPHKRGGVEHRSWEAKRKRVVSRGRRRQRGAAEERAIPDPGDRRGMTPPPGMDGLHVEKGKGSARRGGRRGRGGGIAAAAGMARRKQKNLNRKRWRVLSAAVESDEVVGGGVCSFEQMVSEARVDSRTDVVCR